MGLITHRPEEPYVNSTSTVLWEPGRVTAPRLPDVRQARHFGVEVSHVDKSYPEALTEGTRHRGGKGADPENRVSGARVVGTGPAKGGLVEAVRWVAVSNESEAP